MLPSLPENETALEQRVEMHCTFEIVLSYSIEFTSTHSWHYPRLPSTQPRNIILCNDNAVVHLWSKSFCSWRWLLQKILTSETFH
jgi:hypothetical protein